jgi:flagellar basal body P-ring formation protein FlgA
MRPRPRTAYCCLFVFALARAAASPLDVEPVTRIAAVARAAAAVATGRPASDLEVATIDPRLRLPPCALTPAGRLTPGTRSVAQLTIEVRCTAPAWREYVSVRVRAEESVVVAARTLSRLQPVAAEDIEVVPRELATLPAGYFRRPEEVIGRLADRNVGVGEVLDPRLVRSPPIIKRGQSVTLIVSSGGISVRAAGVALADAGLAERVRVRNTATSRLLEGVARSAEVVEVALE